LEEGATAVPQIYKHCENVYAAMRKTAREVTEGKTRMVVWEGHLTRLIGTDLDLPTPYYTAIRGHLLAMGCVRQLRRGGGTATSQWELLKPPTPTLFDEANSKPRPTQDGPAEQRVRDLLQRVAVLEKNQAVIIDAMNDEAETVEG
jgi:hypothetical protein